MNTLFKIVFAGLFVSVINCSSADLDFFDDTKTLKRNITEAYETDNFAKIESCLAKERYLAQFKQDRGFAQNNVDRYSQLLSQEELSHSLLEIVATSKVDEDEKQSRIQSYIFAGASVNAQDKDFRIPLHRSALNNEEKTTEQLLAAGARIDAQDIYGCTPLHYSAIKNAEKTTAQLLAAGARIDAQDIYGCTPLHLSAHNNAEKTTDQLLAAGANIYVRNINCRTPWQYAPKSDKMQKLFIAAHKEQATNKIRKAVFGVNYL
jgi:ankyrin repeat protein